jgi:putative peptide zinc metalloprotease protein
MEAIVELGFATPEAILEVSGGWQAAVRPRLAEGVRIAGFRDGDGQPYWVARGPGDGAASPSPRRYLMLNHYQKFIWDRLDGNHSLGQINIEFTHSFRRFGARTVEMLAEKLGQAGFLEGVSPSATGLQHPPAWKAVLRAMIWHKFPVRGVDRVVGRLYRLLGPAIWHPVSRAILGLVVVAGFFLFVWEMHSLVWRSPTRGWALGIASTCAYLVCLMLHELGHALSCKRHELSVSDGGFALYLCLPCFYVSTVDCWMAPLPVRVSVSFAGSFVNLVLAGSSAALGVVPGPVGQFFFLLASMNYLTILANLNPLGRLDGYYIAMDLIGVPRLRAQVWKMSGRALAALLGGRWRQLPRTPRLVLLYAAISLLYTGGTLALVVLYLLYPA